MHTTGQYLNPPHCTHHPVTPEVDRDAPVFQEERKATWPLKEGVQNHKRPATVLLGML